MYQLWMIISTRISIHVPNSNIYCFQKIQQLLLIEPWHYYKLYLKTSHIINFRFSIEMFIFSFKSFFSQIHNQIINMTRATWDYEWLMVDNNYNKMLLSSKFRKLLGNRLITIIWSKCFKTFVNWTHQWNWSYLVEPWHRFKTFNCSSGQTIFQFIIQHSICISSLDAYDYI